MSDEGRTGTQMDPVAEREAAEREAIQRLKRGDIAGLEALVLAHQTRALRTAYLIVGDVPTAEDLVTDAFLRAYHAIDQFDVRRPFAPWLQRIVVNLALKYLRKYKREVSAETLDREPDRAPNPHSAAARNESRARIWRAVQMLPAEERTTVVLRYYLDHAEAEIAQTMRCPVGTVKWRLFNARRRLHKALKNDHSAAALQLE